MNHADTVEINKVEQYGDLGGVRARTRGWLRT
jgi:hypothetical protein